MPASDCEVTGRSSSEQGVSFGKKSQAHKAVPVVGQGVKGPVRHLVVGTIPTKWGNDAYSWELP